MVKKGEFTGFQIVGDFNYNDIEWDESLQGKLLSSCSKHREFLEHVEESGVYQNVNFKTFQTEDGNLTNTLDLIFTESENRIDSVKAGPPLGVLLKKAHLVLSWNYNLKEFSRANLEYKKSKFMYNKGDFKKLSEFLNIQDWEKKFKDNDVQFCYSELLNIYNKGCETFIPKIDISVDVKTQPKWLTSGMKRNMRKRLNLWYSDRRAKGLNSGVKKEYERVKKLCESEVKNAVKNYEKNIANNA